MTPTDYAWKRPDHIPWRYWGISAIFALLCVPIVAWAVTQWMPENNGWIDDLVTSGPYAAGAFWISAVILGRWILNPRASWAFCSYLLFVATALVFSLGSFWSMPEISIVVLLFAHYHIYIYLPFAVVFVLTSRRFGVSRDRSVEAGA